jgi:crotonobetainyl-CoA:carnitine CoA-transferase CaiB-like acyl-CoA transferase
VSLPLSGLKVLDLSRLLPGPFATLVLADLGADVVKVEEPDGDPLRATPPLTPAGSAAFLALNRNKRSIVLDLREAAGAAALRRLARNADVLVESFRPGVLERLGCGPARLLAENPHLVVCSITGYGQDGPYATLAGHDLDYCAIAGALAVNGTPDRPLPYGVQVADVAGGAWPAVAAILAALVRRATTGQGGVADVSMTEGALAVLALPLAMAAARGTPLARGAEPLSGGSACYRTYRTADGRFVALAALEPRFFARFCEAAGRADLAPRQWEDGGRGPHADLEALFLTRTRDAWAALGREADCCLAPVLEGNEPREDPQLRARRAFVEVPDGAGGSVLGVACPVRLDRAQAPLRPAPRLGADGDEVLREAGFTPSEIEALRATGALGPSGA